MKIHSQLLPNHPPEMRRCLVPPLAEIDLTHPVGVERVALVWVYHNHKETTIGVDQLRLIASLQVPEYGSVVEIGQIDHVLAFFKLENREFESLPILQNFLLKM